MFRPSQVSSPCPPTAHYLLPLFSALFLHPLNSTHPHPSKVVVTHPSPAHHRGLHLPHPSLNTNSTSSAYPPFSSFTITSAAHAIEQAVELGLVGLLTRPVLNAVYSSTPDVHDHHQQTTDDDDKTAVPSQIQIGKHPQLHTQQSRRSLHPQQYSADGTDMATATQTRTQGMTSADDNTSTRSGGYFTPSLGNKLDGTDNDGYYDASEGKTAPNGLDRHASSQHYQNGHNDEDSLSKGINSIGLGGPNGYDRSASYSSNKRPG